MTTRTGKYVSASQIRFDTDEINSAKCQIADGYLYITVTNPKTDWQVWSN